MRPRFHLTIAALALTTFTTAQATISLPTITPVPIPAGTLIYEGGGATLDNFVSQDLFANTTADWTSAAIVLELTAGSIYQDTLGCSSGSGPSNPILIGLVPSLGFDSYVTEPSGLTAVPGAAGDLNSLVFRPDETTGLSISWDDFGASNTNFGATNIGRFTLSDDAQGTWSLAITEAFNPVAKFLNNPIINGQMVVDPMQGDLNSDGFVGLTDLNTILGNWNQTVPPANPRADPTGDGFVGIADLTFLLSNWNQGLVPLVSGSYHGVPINRDLNWDGFVGLDDKNILNSNWNLTVPPADPRADPSGDGFVGFDDKVNINWNAGTPPSPISGGNPPAVVPEPASLGLLAVGSGMLLWRRA
jgi:hypothetical protein